MAIEALSAEAEWIPCSERLPKENEYVDNVCKYYLIQDDYGDMHVAHLSGRGWETIESIKALGCDVIAWMPLPKPYKRLYDECDTKYYYCALEDRPNRNWSVDDTDYCSWGAESEVEE